MTKTAADRILQIEEPDSVALVDFIYSSNRWGACIEIERTEGQITIRVSTRLHPSRSDWKENIFTVAVDDSDVPEDCATVEYGGDQGDNDSEWPGDDDDDGNEEDPEELDLRASMLGN